MRVLITGASRGIGAGIARRLANDALAGGETPHLALTASRQSDYLTAIGAELEEQGARARALVGDMADPARPGRTVGQALGLWGGLEGGAAGVFEG